MEVYTTKLSSYFFLKCITFETKIWFETLLQPQLKSEKMGPKSQTLVKMGQRYQPI